MNNEIPINIQKKPKVENVEKLKVKSPQDVYNLKEVQAIKDAIQEHLLFVGLDNSHNLRNITFLGIGTSSGIQVNSKDIIRTALINACDRVILVHNHPSNSLVPSRLDRQMTDKTYKMMEVFNVHLIDHMIVTEENYVSMAEKGYINKEFKDKDISIIDNTFLIEENKILKDKIKKLENKRNKSNELER